MWYDTYLKVELKHNVLIIRFRVQNMRFLCHCKHENIFLYKVTEKNIGILTLEQYKCTLDAYVFKVTSYQNILHKKYFTFISYSSSEWINKKETRNYIQIYSEYGGGVNFIGQSIYFYSSLINLSQAWIGYHLTNIYLKHIFDMSKHCLDRRLRKSR